MPYEIPDDFANLPPEVLAVIACTPITEWERTYRRSDRVGPCSLADALHGPDATITDELRLNGRRVYAVQVLLKGGHPWARLAHAKEDAQGAAAEVLMAKHRDFVMGPS